MAYLPRSNQSLHVQPCAFCANATGTKQSERDAAVNRFAKDPDMGVLCMDDLGSVSAAVTTCLGHVLGFPGVWTIALTSG
jgi:hypothetical protein